MSEIPDGLREPLVELILAIADDKLLIGHRNSDWTGLAPILEEDIAFSSLAQDEIAHAQTLYQLAGTINDTDPDQIAFGREPKDFRSSAIVEVPDRFDWATAIARQLFCAHFDALRLDRMANSSYTPLADLAKRLRAEEQIHIEHADAWIERLGRGTDAAKQRLQDAVDALAPLTASLFEPTERQGDLEAAGLYPDDDRDLHAAWSDVVTGNLDRAGLTVTLPTPETAARGGRRGVHGEHLAPLLDEMCEVFRLEPDAAW